MNVNEHHVHHLAKRLHQAHSKLDQLTARWSGAATAALGTAEVSAGAFLGGVLEGKTEGGSLGPIPYNLLAGAALLTAGHLNLAGDAYSEHINNVGTGLVAGYIASKGFAFGQRWQQNGSLRGAFGGSPAAQLPGPVVQGEVSPAALQQMVNSMSGAVG